MICNREINAGTTEKEKKKRQQKQSVRSLITKIGVTPSEPRTGINTLPISQP